MYVNKLSVTNIEAADRVNLMLRFKNGPFRLFSKYKQKLPFCHTF